MLSRGRIGLSDFPLFCIIVRNGISVTTFGGASISDMLKNQRLFEARLAGDCLHLSLFQGKGITMKILFFGAGPLGSLYAHLLHQAGKDVTIIARDERYNFIKEHGLVLVNEYPLGLAK